jgi:surfactin synthase thioesterase subunit
MAAAKNSKRVKVIVTRRFGDGEDKNKIFVSTVILKNDRRVLEQFRVPVDTPVDLPVEVIKALKSRAIPKEKSGALKMVAEFTIEKA